MPAGSFNLLLGLRAHPEVDLSSVVAMTDSGGDSGRLRDEFGVLPPGDVRRCVVALSVESKLLRDLFNFRFSEPPLEGRNFGNLFFLALTRMLGSESEAVAALNRILRVRGRVLPVTWDDSHLYAELENGEIVQGEANIDVPKHDASVPIRRVFLEPKATANPDAVRAIKESDFVVLAPGDLFTSTVANLLVSGVEQALSETSAPLVYVLNLMTKYGETTGYSASSHVKEIARYAGRVPDVVLAHDGTIPASLIERYREEAAHPVQLDEAELLALGVKTVHQADLTSSLSLLRHDPERTAQALLDVFASEPRAS
jgi:uncharacterized cofD-like protein